MTWSLPISELSTICRVDRLVNAKELIPSWDKRSALIGGPENQVLQGAFLLTEVIRGKEMKKRLKKMATLARSGLGFMGGALLAMLITTSPIHAGWLVEEQKLVAPDAAPADSFGTSIAVSGNTAVVGAPGNDGSGSAYIFVRTGGVWSNQKATWSLQAKLKASDAAENGNFGQSVAISNDTVVVGASPFYGQRGLIPKPGSAYVFVRNESSWSEQAKLMATHPKDDDHFGISVGVVDGWAVVGASWDDDAGPHTGAAYVFEGRETAWNEWGVLRARNQKAGSFFGHSVSIDDTEGYTIAVGAIGDDEKGQAAGAAYVFTRGRSSFYSGEKLMPSDLTSHQQFGFSVAVNNNTVVVGAPYDETGSAYVFIRPNNDYYGEWSEQSKLTAIDGANEDLFGESVAVFRDTAVVSAKGDDDMGDLSGAVYTFARSGANWSQNAKLMDSEATTEYRRFGTAVDISRTKETFNSEIVLVGVSQDNPGGPISGSASAFDLTCAPNFGSTLYIPNNQWLMVSLPCDPGGHNTVAEIFGDEIPGFYGTEWIMYRYAGGSHVPLESDTRLIQGEGYWIMQNSGGEVLIDLPSNSTSTPVTRPEGCPPGAKGCFEIPLKTQANTNQWNLIGYPFWAVSSFGNARVVTDSGVCAIGCDLDTAQSQGVIQNQLWTLNHNGKFEIISPSSDLKPLMGYWALTLNQADGTNPRLLVPKP